MLLSEIIPVSFLIIVFCSILGSIGGRFNSSWIFVLIFIRDVVILRWIIIVQANVI